MDIETETGIFVGEINGVRCVVEVLRFSDGEESRYFYCTDPAAAGLAVKPAGNFFSDFFGD